MEVTIVKRIEIGDRIKLDPVVMGALGVSAGDVVELTVRLVKRAGDR